MSWKPEVQVNADGSWSNNALVFETEQEAEDSARALMMRWLAVRDSRAVESTDPVNYKIEGGKLIPVDKS